MQLKGYQIHLNSCKKIEKKSTKTYLTCTKFPHKAYTPTVLPKIKPYEVKISIPRERRAKLYFPYGKLSFALSDFSPSMLMIPHIRSTHGTRQFNLRHIGSAEINKI